MTRAMETKLYCKLKHLQELVQIAGMTEPIFPKECDALITLFPSHAYTLEQISDAENALGVFLRSLKIDDFVAEDSYCVEVICRATSFLYDLLRCCRRVEEGSVILTSTAEIKEAVSWNNFVAVFREVVIKWRSVKGYDIFNPNTMFMALFPDEVKKLPVEYKKDLLISIPTNPLELSYEFRNFKLQRSMLISLSNKVKVLQDFCNIYDVDGVAWKYFLSSNDTKIPVFLGMEIVSDLSKVKSAYMEYRATVFNLCFNK